MMQKWRAVPSIRYTLKRWGWLFVAILIFLCQTMWHFNKPTAPDVVQIYLPLAKKFLAQGISFFLQPESIIALPVSYLWPSLFGGDIVAIKSANVFCGVLMILLTYGIGQQLHSRIAGLIAAFLFAVSPLIVRWIPTALSEPPFYLFTLIWLWGMGEVIAGKKWAIPIASIALSMSILTRAIWFYPSIVILFFVSLLFIFKFTARTTTCYTTVALALGLVIPILVIIKNIVLFGVPTIESGSGGALFLGTNILTNGFEPPLLGLTYETGNIGFKNAIGNQEHARVAMQFLKERSVFDLFDWFLTKISWATLFTTLEAPIFVSVWRAIELAIAFAGLWWGIKQKNFFVLFIGSGIVLQILQTAFPSYNIRYSIDGIELLLIPLVAVGIAASLNITVNEKSTSKSKMHFYRRHQHAIVAVSITAVLFLALYFRSVPTINLPSHIPVSVLYKNEDIVQINQSLALDDDKKIFSLQAVLNVPKQALPSGTRSAIWEIKMAVLPSSGGSCIKSSASFHSNNSLQSARLDNHEPSENNTSLKEVSHWLTFVKSWFKSTQNRSTETGEVYFNVYNDSIAHTYLLGSAVSGAELFPTEAGKLTLKFDCSPDVQIILERVSLVAPHFIETYFK